MECCYHAIKTSYDCHTGALTFPFLFYICIVSLQLQWFVNAVVLTMISRCAFISMTAIIPRMHLLSHRLYVAGWIQRGIITSLNDYILSDCNIQIVPSSISWRTRRNLIVCWNLSVNYKISCKRSIDRFAVILWLNWTLPM